MHALCIRLIELNNLHNIVHRTPPQSKILATPMASSDVKPYGLAARQECTASLPLYVAGRL